MYISYCGVDGSGKSSQLKVAASLLQSAGLDVVVTREPGGTELGKKLRDLLLHGDAMSAQTEALLMYADRTHHIESVVIPALARGAVVLSDRSLDCTAAFQTASGLPPEQLAALESFVPRELWPSHTLLFDLPTSVAIERIQAERGLDRFEAKDAQYHARVRDNYLARAQAEPARFAVIDASQSIDNVEAQVTTEMQRIIDIIKSA